MMKKYILIYVMAVACLVTASVTASATPYSQSRMTKTSVRGSRTSITYGRQSLGIGRQTMDMSSRRMELRRSSDGLQTIESNGGSQGGYYHNVSTPAPRTRSVYTMTERPERVSAYQPHAVSVQRSSATRQELVRGWEPEVKRYQVVSSTVGVESHFNGGSYGSGSSSNVSYGRTSSGESSLVRSVSSFVSSARPASMAYTTNEQESDGENSQSTIQQFGENPTYDSAPMGDAIIPMMILVLGVVLLKFRKLIATLIISKLHALSRT